MYYINPPLPNRCGYHNIWGQLHGSASGLVLANAARNVAFPLVVITNDSASTILLTQELNFYLKKKNI